MTLMGLVSSGHKRAPPSASHLSPLQREKKSGPSMKPHGRKPFALITLDAGILVLVFLSYIIP
ncbi:hypothetical protein BM221_004019 [Beauveria bassiana]|uniref:Uncharacterized protein n=1 Tax=Beauveria bassiana TaxID=176275 RepID=A0A2N6NQ32_BEABA|nr:hypothetical protein BM221_004019 [Beauveria bassiana]